MWKKLYDIANLLFNFGQDLRQNRADLKQLQNEVKELSSVTQNEVIQLRETIQRLAYEIQRVEENAVHEREKQDLRHEVEKLRASQQLPEE